MHLRDAFLLAPWLAAVLQTTNLGAADPMTSGDRPVFPTSEWATADPESAGYSAPRLEALRAWLQAQPTTAMMVVVHGRVIFSHGDVTLTSKIASVRKSVLAMLYGRHVVDGTINLARTVKDVGLQEAEPFLPIEESATLEHLITARSGIYLPSGNADLDRLTPKRGTQYPGTFHDYNNWDFNAAGTAFEKLTGQDIFAALETELARPIGMQDYLRAAQKKVASAGSVHPEYAMYLSTRDMARLGLLMLREGTWDGTVVVPPEWCRYITSLITPWVDVHPTQLRVDGQPDRWGYGAMWWVWDAPRYPGGVTTGALQGAYTAMGAGGQFITVVPSADLVIAHKVDIDRPPDDEVHAMGYHTILSMVISAQKAVH